MKVNVPGVVGVPLHTPAELNDRPGTPLFAAQVYGGRPPTATSDCVYDAFTRPLASGEVVEIISAPGEIVSWYELDAVAPALSMTCIEKLYAPVLLGVPLITPAALTVKPGGSVPLLLSHLV